MAIPLELLAPAGNAEIGMAAIDHGADAVYIGAPRFSARAAAGNEPAEIERLIRHARPFYAKVYVALNTILTDAEIPEAIAIIKQVYEMGADALIIQDVGLLELDLPPIPLIASTQMHNATPEKVKFLEAVGFKRIILARELSLTEIAAIRKQTRVELEAFVHGALCVSYSGQCYMSQAVAQRSGNRGVCAQPCRSRFDLLDRDGALVLKDKYPLCLKDLNLLWDLPALVAAGVTSFKIEGRYKDSGYVKNVTASYRQALDRLMAEQPVYGKSSSGKVFFSFTPDLERTFNRGYTRYFIHGTEEKAGSMDTPKALGKLLGIITAVGKDYFIARDVKLHNGDGLCFFTANQVLDGFRVNRVDRGRVYPNSMKGLTVGAILYRNHDQAFEHVLKKQKTVRQVGVEMDFFQEVDGIRLEVKDEDGHIVSHFLAILMEPAKDPEQARRRIHAQLAGTGNTPYHATRITLHPENPGFTAVRFLNQLRREALAALTVIRLSQYPREVIPFMPNAAPYPETQLDFRANVLNRMARRFYERHGAAVNEPAFETLAHPAGKTVMTTRYCIRHQLDACLRKPKAYALKEPLTLKDAHHRYRLEFDCENCRMRVIIV